MEEKACFDHRAQKMTPLWAPSAAVSPGRQPPAVGCRGFHVRGKTRGSGRCANGGLEMIFLHPSLARRVKLIGFIDGAAFPNGGLMSMIFKMNE
jgi:hypothetical protein